jgi:hypothetical protein
MSFLSSTCSQLSKSPSEKVVFWVLPAGKTSLEIHEGRAGVQMRIVGWAVRHLGSPCRSVNSSFDVECGMSSTRYLVVGTGGGLEIVKQRWDFRSKTLSSKSGGKPVENEKAVELGTQRFSVRSTPKKDLRQVDFVFDGNEIRGLEQNPQMKSRWAQMVRAGK